MMIGRSQAVRHRSLEPTFPWFESRRPSFFYYDDKYVGCVWMQSGETIQVAPSPLVRFRLASSGMAYIDLQRRRRACVAISVGLRILKSYEHICDRSAGSRSRYADAFNIDEGAPSTCWRSPIGSCAQVG